MASFQQLQRASDQTKTTRDSKLKRVMGDEVFPQSLKNRSLENAVLENVAAYGVQSALPSGSTLTLTTTTQHGRLPDEIRIGVQPFQLALFEDTASLLNQIPLSTNVTWGDYEIVGPLHEPSVHVTNPPLTIDFTLGSDTKIISKTYIHNSSGGPHDIIYITGARSFNPVGGVTA